MLSETDIQKETSDFFKDLEEKQGNFTFFAVPGGSVRIPPHIGKRLKDMGVRAGVHDLIFLLQGGGCVLIELKLRGNGLSKSQKIFHGIVKKLGCASFVVVVDDAIEAIGTILKILKVHGLKA